VARYRVEVIFCSKKERTVWEGGDVAVGKGGSLRISLKAMASGKKGH